ncbi:mandelate racemase/muconate lactonizing enzyme family protein [Limnochorda pilosa]|uniref:Mandelate racemase n=1 Tax=Limnochorda pilosa TaxID=1555112 RepID=A0A0K2SGX3_LIMPI|nr:mandelate racemase/muconate lactonizing enzyme family protein [Limnochorda pilosa]BAS26366.1 mandelate racemase [Limnochorda pilosa]
MKITRVAAHLLRSVVKPALLPDQAGLRSLEISAVLVEVETDVGVTGVGESFYRSLEDNRFLAESVRAMGRHVVGKDPLDVSQRWQELYVHVKRSGAYGALSALDEAMWDIKGKVAGRPIYQLLGGKTTPVRAYATYPLGQSIEEAVEGAHWLAEHGFQLMKIPVGRGVDHDRKVVRELVPRLPKGFGLAIDANTTYSFSDAFAVAETASEHGVAWFEEPIEHMDLQGMAELNRRLSVPIAGYQTFNTHYPAVELLKANALDVYQPSLDYVGGVTAAQRVGVLVEAFGKRLVPHTMGPIVNFAASLHVAAAQRACTLIEFPVLSRDVENPGRVHTGTYVTNVEEISLREDGTLLPPERPGIGVEIDWEAVRSVQEAELSVQG